jgi:hypothetical protein
MCAGVCVRVCAYASLGWDSGGVRLLSVGSWFMLSVSSALVDIFGRLEYEVCMRARAMLHGTIAKAKAAI